MKRTTPPVILIVDDNELVCLVLQLALEQAGCQTVIAHSGQEAMQQVAARGLDLFHLLLLDYHLDEAVSGYELYERWHAGRPDLPIVLMSGSPDASELPAVQGGAVPLIRKPFDLDAATSMLIQLASKGTR